MSDTDICKVCQGSLTAAVSDSKTCCMQHHAEACDVEGVGPGPMSGSDCIEGARARARVLHQSASTPLTDKLPDEAQACDADDDVYYNKAGRLKLERV